MTPMALLSMREILTGEIIHPDDEYDFHFQDPRDRATSHLPNNHKTRLKDPDYEALRPNFGWAPIKLIKKTFAKSTQFFVTCTACHCASISRVASQELMLAGELNQSPWTHPSQLLLPLVEL